ncbi:MAG: carbohydrate-binding domain-containing protein, partial [Eubacterium sp.]|nr:carbohydrate-binding domain-containing protein [Eubacterium sp.]
VKAEDSICFSGGTFDLKCVKDAVHCDNDTASDKGNIYIKNTTLNITAEDDAVHASGFIIIDDGQITVTSSYEGIEAQKIEINGGIINIKSSDDGINASSGNTESSENQTEEQLPFDKANPFEGDENCYVNITGGNIIVDADGDGIDSNGYLLQSGGDVKIYGPENSGNAALDYDLQAKITGGTITAFGFSGMAQSFNSYSTQGTILISFESESSEKFILTDDDNNEIISCETNKKYNSVVVSTPDITVGNTYIAKAGEQTKTIEFTDISYSDKGMMENGGGRSDGPGKQPSDMPNMDDRGGMKEPRERNNDADFK